VLEVDDVGRLAMMVEEKRKCGVKMVECSKDGVQLGFSLAPKWLFYIHHKKCPIFLVFSPVTMSYKMLGQDVSIHLFLDSNRNTGCSYGYGSVGDLEISRPSDWSLGKTETGGLKALFRLF